jgi:hypothetical protein
LLFYTAHAQQRTTFVNCFSSSMIMRFSKINNNIYLFIYLFIYLCFGVWIIGLLKVCFLLGFIGWNLYLMWSSVNCRHNVRHIRTIPFLLPPDWDGWPLNLNNYLSSLLNLSDRGRMVVEFTPTCAIVAYHYLSCEFGPHSRRGVLYKTLCDRWAKTMDEGGPLLSMSSIKLGLLKENDK